MDIIQKNRLLVQEIPWLAGDRKWIDDGSPEGVYVIPETYDYEWTILDMIPKGWLLAFGIEMVHEIDAALKKQGEDVRNHYYVMEIKEKYGELRWYDNGDKEIQKIIDKYVVISRNTCMVCGKPDVSVRQDGWIWPECRECYEKDTHNFLPYEEVVDMEESCTIPDFYSIIQYSPGEGHLKISYSIKKEADQVRKKYKKRMQNKDK